MSWHPVATIEIVVILSFLIKPLTLLLCRLNGCSNGFASWGALGQVHVEAVAYQRAAHYFKLHLMDHHSKPALFTHTFSPGRALFNITAALANAWAQTGNSLRFWNCPS